MNNDWWDFIYPGYGLVEYRFMKDGRMVGQHWREKPVDPADLFDSVEPPHHVYQWDVYYGVLPRKSKGGKAEDCWPTTTVLWADVDAKDHCPNDWGDCHGPAHKGVTPVDKAAALDAILRFPLTPSAIIDSGHGYHLYWKLEQPEEFADAQFVMKGIARWVKGDTTYDQPRILRVPGTTNWKDPQNPVPVRILKLDTLKRYDLSDFAEVTMCLQDFSEPDTRVHLAQGERRGDAPDWLRDLINEEPPKGARSETEFRAGLWLARFGYTDEEILSVFMNSPVGAKAQERGERWAAQDVARIRRKV